MTDHWKSTTQPIRGGINLPRSLLFVLKLRGTYGPYEPYCETPEPPTKPEPPHPPGWPWGLSSGLLNSVLFVVDMLNAAGIQSRMVQVVDGNAIDREVKKHQPTDVILEAFWCPPDKLVELARLYPRVRWFVRNHSEIPFLSLEGIAMEWSEAYLANPNVSLASNTAGSVADLRMLAEAWSPHWDRPTLAHRVVYLPNYYPMPAPLPRIPSPFGVLNIACFGAIRPLKNQLIQAVAALAAAKQRSQRLRFHINGSRVEFKSDNILKNLKAVFAGTPNAELVPHDWVPRPQFLDLCRRMDAGMQVSFSETFNIVTADFVTNNLPVVVSPEIDWVDARYRADPANAADIAAKLLAAIGAGERTGNRAGLLKYDEASRAVWLQQFGFRPDFGWWPETDSFMARPAIAGVATHL
jgi:hypothetical protein